MALKFFSNLFRKHKKGHIGLTAEEAYAPLDEDQTWEEEKEEPVYVPENTRTARPQQAEYAAPEEKTVPQEEDAAAEKIPEHEQSPFSLWMYGYVEEREIAMTLIRGGIISAFRSVSEGLGPGL